jgi:hypothetical protein
MPRKCRRPANPGNHRESNHETRAFDRGAVQMTPEERAKQIAWDEFDREDDTTTSLENLISEAIKHFIQEEREACAKLVEERGNYHGVYSTIDPKITAKAIRERK